MTNTISEPPVQPPMAAQHASPNKLQFGVADLLSLTFVIGFAATYLRTHHDQIHLPTLALASIALASVAAGIVGVFRNAVAESLFWGLLLAVMVQVVVVDVDLLHRSGLVVWPVATAFAACLVATARPHRRVRRMLLGAFAMGLPLTVHAILVADPLTNGIPNVICALLGTGLAIVITICQWLESAKGVRQGLLAAALACGAIAVAWLAPTVIPGW